MIVKKKNLKNYKKSSKAKKSAPKRMPRKVAAPRTLSTVITARAGQMTHSDARHIHKRNHQSALIKDISAPSMLSQSYGFNQLSSAGIQTSVSTANIGTGTLTSILANVALATTGSTTVARGGSRAVILGAVNEYLIANAVETSTTVDIYDIVLKRDLPAAWTATIGGVSYTANTPNPETYWRKGLNIQQNVGDAGPTVGPQLNDMLSVVPTDSRLFNNYFKIVKKTRVQMCAGATHKHKVNISTNRMIDQLYVNTQMAGSLGFSTYTMFVAVGTPVWDTIVEGGEVTTSPVSLNVVATQRVRWAYVADQTYQSSVATTLDQPISSGLSFVSSLNGTLTTGVNGAPQPS